MRFSRSHFVFIEIILVAQKASWAAYDRQVVVYPPLCYKMVKEVLQLLSIQLFCSLISPNQEIQMKTASDYPNLNFFNCALWFSSTSVA